MADDWSTWMHVSRRVHGHAPTFTWMNTWYDAPCRAWQAPSHQRVRIVGTRLHAPVLLLNEQHDAATPYSGALRTRALFPTSRLVEGVGGVSHAASLESGPCTQRVITAFLADGPRTPDVGGVGHRRVPPPLAAAEGAGRPAEGTRKAAPARCVS